MAKPAWLIISPASGSGNGTISNSAEAHTGRVARTGTVTVTGTGVATPATYGVTQLAKAEFAAFTEGSELAVSKDGGNVTIQGTSNSSKLTFSWVTPSGADEPEVDPDGNTSYNGINFPTVTIPTTYSAGGVTTDNGVAITGDPGADAEFTFEITLNFPANTAIVEVWRTLLVTCNGAQSAQITTKQAAGDAYLTLDVNAITIPQAGTAQSVAVTSNTSWTVS